LKLGTITYDESQRAWVVDAQPHVMMRLKRVFASVKAGKTGPTEISDTRGNARDLEWFLERYPLEVPERARLAARATEQRQAESLALKIMEGGGVRRRFDLAVPAREYQKVAAELALASGGLLLADDLGLGKTASAITMLTDPMTRPAVVVTMTHLTRQWQAELARFAPSMRTHILRSTKPYELDRKCRHRLRPDSFAPGAARCTVCGASRDDIYHGRTSGLPDVVITNYQKLAGWSDVLAAFAKGVVFDEAQELRSGLARDTPGKYLAAQSIAAASNVRLGLTATPIYNYGAEIFSVLNVLRPDALGTFSEFVTAWCDGYEDPRKTRLANPEAFGTFARSEALMLRRTRAEVGRELPQLSKFVQVVDSDPAELEKLSQGCAELAKIILRESEAERGQKMRASEELSNRLRQATGVAKAPFVASFVRLLVESGEPVVLYGWHRQVYEIWLEKLADLNPIMYTGSESPGQKAAARDAFIKGDSKVLIMSLRAGAGLDGLQQMCRTGVFGELDWSPGVLEQCGGRLHRDGQQEPVTLYFLVSEEGADPIMTDVLGVKRWQVEGLRDPGMKPLEAMTIDPNHVKRLAEDYLARMRESAA
jgi:SNF2 family DNA or RNA helicase